MPLLQFMLILRVTLGVWCLWEKAQTWQCHENKSSTQRVVPLQNLLELMTSQQWWFGQSFSWKNKVILSKKKILQRIIRVQFYWKKWPKACRKAISSIDVQYIFIADQVNKANRKVMYCPTDEMIRAFMTKPLQGKKFLKFREAIMGNWFRPPQRAKTGACRACEYLHIHRNIKFTRARINLTLCS